MKKWREKSKELKTKKLYSWFNESADKEEIIYDEGIKSWYDSFKSSYSY
jgi:hypothetical protein